MSAKEINKPNIRGNIKLKIATVSQNLQFNTSIFDILKKSTIKFSLAINYFDDLNEHKGILPNADIILVNIHNQDELLNFEKFQNINEKLTYILIINNKADLNIISLLRPNIAAIINEENIENTAPILKIIYNNRIAQIKKNEEEGNGNKLEYHFSELLEPILIIDYDTCKILNANQKALELYGYNIDEIKGMDFSDINYNGKSCQHNEMPNAANYSHGYFEYIHKKKNNEVINVGVYSSPLISGGKKILSSVIHDISKESEKNDSVLEREYNLIKQHNALLKIAKSKNIKNQNFEESLKEIAELISNYSKAHFVSIWLFNDKRDKLNCVEYFNHLKKKHSKGELIDAKEYENYLEILKSSKVRKTIITSEDSSSVEFLKDTLNIYKKTKIDAPIFLSGEIIGLISCKKLTEEQQWNYDDENFISSIADFVAAIIESNEKKKIGDSQTEIIKNLRENQERYKIYFNSTTDAIFVNYFDPITNLPTKFIEVNKRACLLLGYTKEELLSLSAYDVEEQNEVEIRDNIIQLQKEGKVIFESKYITKDGSKIPVEVSLNLLCISDGKAIICTVRDITERKEYEEQLKTFQTLFETSNQSILITDKGGKVIFANKSTELLTGYKKDEINHSESLTHFIENCIRKINDNLEDELNVLNNWKSSATILNKNNNKIPVDINIGCIKDKNNAPANYFMFMNDITERKKLYSQLKTLSTAVEQSPASIVITDVKGDIEYVNPKFAEVTGYKHDEVMGKNPRILKSGKMSPDGYKELWDTITAGFEWRGEFHNKKKNGELYWEHASLSPIKDKEGNIKHFLAVKEDITDRKYADELLRASLKEKETLLKEIHHRVKNNLQVISSLLNLQSDYIEDQTAKELFNESRNRIKSMGLIHERLYQSTNLSKINFAEYLTDLTRQLFRTYRNSSVYVALDIKTDDSFFPIDYAIPCGLVINELVSNALKYGPVDNKAITLKIRLINNDNLKYTLIVADNGPGIPKDIDLKNANTLGLQLVNDLVNQIDGELHLNRDNGTEFIINFSVDNE